MHFDGIDYDGLRQSICREFGIGSIEKSASAPAAGGKFISNALDSTVGKFSVATLTGLGAVGLGTQAYEQYREKTQPLHKQLANPNSGLGSTARAAAGIGGALLAASLMNEMSRGRHGSTLV